LAIDAIRSFSGLPIIAQLTYSEEGIAYGDLSPRDAALQLKNKNVQVVGANCTIGPQALLPILQQLAAVDDLRVSGMPNAGLPKREGDRIVYPKSSPEYFALFAREAAGLGVRILGGCCGTTPAHIRAMAEAVKSLRPAKTHAVAHSVATMAKPAPISEREPESKFWKKLKAKHFALCVEIDPPKGLSLDRIFEQVDKVMASKKVDAIDINSGAMARVGLVKVLHRLNQGTDWAGKTLGGATNFTIGVALNPVADDLENEIERFHAKVEAGAHFAMTQPLFDPEHWHALLKKLGGKPSIP